MISPAKYTSFVIDFGIKKPHVNGVVKTVVEIP